MTSFYLCLFCNILSAKHCSGCIQKSEIIECIKHKKEYIFSFGIDEPSHQKTAVLTYFLSSILLPSSLHSYPFSYLWIVRPPTHRTLPFASLLPSSSRWDKDNSVSLHPRRGQRWPVALRPAPLLQQGKELKRLTSSWAFPIRFIFPLLKTTALY